jgi:hypothetical protein
VTGGLFFVPSAELLESLGDDDQDDEDDAGNTDNAADQGRPAASGSLNIGSLRGASGDE